MKEYKLSNGMILPNIAFGTYEVSDPMVFATAVKCGYRYFDTASFYKNEEVLGEGLRLAIKEGYAKREELIISSKCWRDEMGYEKTREAFMKSIERLQLDVLDMYLIHWPRPNLKDENWREVSRDTWRALEDLYKEGLVRSIGVSNFLVPHLENILSGAEIMPMVSQLELHPGYLQNEARSLAEKNGMVMLGWSPLGKGRLTDDSLLKEIALKYNISVQELCLAFEGSQDIIPLPRSTNEGRMKANLAAVNILLDDSDIASIKAMKRTGWSGEHPDHERVKPPIDIDAWTEW